MVTQNTSLNFFVCGVLAAMISCGGSVKKGDVSKIAEPKITTSAAEENAPIYSGDPSWPYAAIGVVATVGEQEISAENFNGTMRRMLSIEEVRKSMGLDSKEQVIRNLVNIQLVRATVAPNVTAKALEKELKQFSDEMNQNPGGVEGFYKRFGMTEDEFRTETKNGLALKALQRTDFDIKVTQEEIDDYYKNNITRFKKSAEVKASHILFKPSSDDEAGFAEAKKKAMAVYKLAIQPGVDFAELAREKSEGPSAPEGGDLGFFSADKMVPDFSKAAFAAQKGEITKPVRTSFGYHIIKVLERTKAETTPISEVSLGIEKKLEIGKIKTSMRTFRAQQWAKTKVEIFLENVVDNPKFESSVK